jgi:hypothetical protein
LGIDAFAHNLPSRLQGGGDGLVRSPSLPASLLNEELEDPAKTILVRRQFSPSIVVSKETGTYYSKELLSHQR